MKEKKAMETVCFSVFSSCQWKIQAQHGTPWTSFVVLPSKCIFPRDPMSGLYRNVTVRPLSKTTLLAGTTEEINTPQLCTKQAVYDVASTVNGLNGHKQLSPILLASSDYDCKYNYLSNMECQLKALELYKTRIPRNILQPQMKCKPYRTT